MPKHPNDEDLFVLTLKVVGMVAALFGTFLSIYFIL
jgi:hypothetical protein